MKFFAECFCCVLLVCCTGCSLLADTLSPSETIRFVVTDEGGDPVSGVAVVMEWERGGKVDGATDADGVVILTASGQGVLWVSADKEGYYGSGGQIFSSGFTYPELAKKNDIRIHSNPLYMRGGMYLTRPREEIYIELKRIKNPMPMYVRRIELRPLPVLNQKVGFDFEIGDWVAPHGRGRVSDIFFKGNGWRESWDNYDINLTISFEGDLDGMIEMDIPEKRYLFSDLQSPTEAPLGGYGSELSFPSKRLPSGSLISPNSNNRVYLFRVRTQADSEGNIMSTNHGKIYRGLKYVWTSEDEIKVIFDYYFNPDPNSRSLEYNGENLFRKPKPLQVRMRPGMPPPPPDDEREIVFAP